MFGLVASKDEPTTSSYQIMRIRKLTLCDNGQMFPVKQAQLRVQKVTLA